MRVSENCEMSLYYKWKSERTCLIILTLTSTYVVLNLRQWVQDLSLHPLSCVPGARYHKLWQPFLQESFAFGSRCGLEELVLS